LQAHETIALRFEVVCADCLQVAGAQHDECIGFVAFDHHGEVGAGGRDHQFSDDVSADQMLDRKGCANGIDAWRT
jgi:hypothetical protein